MAPSIACMAITRADRASRTFHWMPQRPRTYRARAPRGACLGKHTMKGMVLRNGVLAALLASGSMPAHADVFCADSEASAQAAINTARTNGQADYIKLEAGFYSLTTGLQYSTGGSSDHEI